MHQIVIIGTRHESLGKCNSEELFKILKRIDPVVIFEEIPPSFFDKYYVERSRRNLESDSINMYRNERTFQQVLVDSEDVPTDSFFDAYYKLMKKIEGSISEDGFRYRNYIDTVRNNISKLGFEYLNSLQNMAINIEINKIIESSLQEFDDATLNEVYKKWIEINNTRENLMLYNIYNFCKTTQFERAVFTIGAGHLYSMNGKIKNIQVSNNLKLNWSFLTQ